MSSFVALLAVALLGLSAGAMLAEGAVLVPYWRSLPAPDFLAWYATNAALLLHFFGPLEIAAAAFASAAAALHRWQRRAGSALLVLAAVLSIAVLAGFPLYFRDVNASFAAGTIDVDRVASELGTWARWHWVRTAIGTAAFVVALVAMRGGARDRPS